MAAVRVARSLCAPLARQGRAGSLVVVALLYPSADRCLSLKLAALFSCNYRTIRPSQLDRVLPRNWPGRVPVLCPASSTRPARKLDGHDGAYPPDRATPARATPARAAPALRLAR